MMKIFNENNLFHGYPGIRYNASLLRYGSDYLITYRDRRTEANVWLGRLDASFNPKGSPHMLSLAHPAIGRDDARLFYFRGYPYIAYAVLEEYWKFSVGYARLGSDLQVAEEFHLAYNGDSQKNWSFFSYHNELYCVYKTQPVHTILRIKGNKAELAYESEFNFPWCGGEIRGGASPLLSQDGRTYVHWVHSSKWRNNLQAPLYEMSYLRFEAKPPFKVVECPSQPLFRADLSTWDKTDWWCPVIFPCGAVLHWDGSWTVSCGIHDRWTELKRIYL
jgi:hypothetical protein